jgi:hypothetical protein
MSELSFEAGIVMMLEIAGGILLALFVLVFVLANIGWIVVGLSAIFTIGILIGGVALILFLPSDVRNVLLIVVLGVAAVSAFGCWTHVDKRFLLPDDKSSKEE